MNRNTPSPEQPLENDAVWDLLDQAPPAQAGPRFVDDTVRTARLLKQDAPSPWWKRLLAPVPLAGLAAATATIVIVATNLSPKTTPHTTVSYDSKQAQEIQEIAETEVLIAAADDLGDFSDHELVSLIGF